MKPSAIAKFSSAKARAASQARGRAGARRVLAMRFQPSGESSYQNLAISDCSAVRVVLATWPISLTSPGRARTARWRAPAAHRAHGRAVDDERLHATPARQVREVERRGELVLAGSGPRHVHRLRGRIGTVALAGGSASPSGGLAGGDAGRLGRPSRTVVSARPYALSTRAVWSGISATSTSRAAAATAASTEARGAAGRPGV